MDRITLSVPYTREARCFVGFYGAILRNSSHWVKHMPRQIAAGIPRRLFQRDCVDLISSLYPIDRF